MHMSEDAVVVLSIYFDLKYVAWSKLRHLHQTDF
jgi:hypothetical protein